MVSMETETQAPLNPTNLTLQLEVFEGPLDLLLHMIREQDLDIFDIPIHTITAEFQLYVEMIQRVDLDLAGDYLAMASELAHIKSRMLLPRVEDRDEEDPRQELVEKLIEYEQLQQATDFLQDRDVLNRDVFRRGVDPCVGLAHRPMKKAPVPTDSLMHVFQDMLQRRLQRLGTYHHVKREHVSVRQRIVWLCQMLREAANETIRFSDLLASMHDRVTIIATFLALLELGRLRRIRLVQLDLTDVAIEAAGNLEDIPMQDVASFSNTEPNQDGVLDLAHIQEASDEVDDQTNTQTEADNEDA
jgi:segregation and condensation protein A